MGRCRRLFGRLPGRVFFTGGFLACSCSAPVRSGDSALLLSAPTRTGNPALLLGLMVSALRAAALSFGCPCNSPSAFGAGDATLSVLDAAAASAASALGSGRALLALAEAIRMLFLDMMAPARRCSSRSEAPSSRNSSAFVHCFSSRLICGPGVQGDPGASTRRGARGQVRLQRAADMHWELPPPRILAVCGPWRSAHGPGPPAA